MESLRQDLNYGLRAFSRSPAFASTFVLFLALSLGATTSVFSLLNSLLLRPLPLPHPEQLVQIAGVYRGHSRVPISYPMFSELDRQQRSFSGICGWSAPTGFNVEIGGKLSISSIRSVTGSYFSVLGVQPFLGRLINPADEQGSDVAQVAVLSYEFWNSRFAADRSIVGKPIRIAGKLYTVIGVAPKGFIGMTVGAPAEITVPAGAGQLFDRQSRSSLWLFVTGRLPQGEPLTSARSQLESFWPHLLEQTVPTESAGQRRQSFLSMGLQLEAVATGTDSTLRSRLQKPLYLLLCIVSLILVVVCVNLASLTLARATRRRHETHTRIALGATPWQAVRPFQIETLVLSALGGLLALLCSFWGTKLLAFVILPHQDASVLLNLTPDWRVLSFAALLAVVTGLFIGFVPLAQLLRQHPAAALRQDDRTLGRGTGRLGKAFIVSQIAISLVLVQAAGLFLRTLEELKSFDPGFEKIGVTQFHLAPVPQGYKDVDLGVYRRQLADALTTLPGVRSASFSGTSILAGDNVWQDTVSIPSNPNPSDAFAANLTVITPDFFKTLAIPFLSGRDFSWTDDQQHPRVVIIDSLLAQQLFPKGDAIGKRIRFGVQPDFQDLEIVGIARHARILDVRNSSAALVYVPGLQFKLYAPGALLVRSTGSSDLTHEIESELQSFGHEYIARSATIEESSQRSFVYEQMTATLSTFFASIALFVAGFALFGLMSYAVNLRTREIGIRMALGSQRGSILTLILRESVLITLLGVAIGIPCALIASRMFAHMLFALSFADPLTLTVASCTLLLTGAIAGLFPALRAMKLDPMAALRHE